MKYRYVALIAALTFLAGVGCGAGYVNYLHEKEISEALLALQEIAKDTAQTATENTTAQTQAPTTQPVTEASTEAATTQPATEATTAETTSTKPAPTEPTAVKTDMYDFLRKTLIPKHGLSDLGDFDMEGNLDSSYKIQPIPKSTQGIISAMRHDFNADGAEEYIIFRAEENTYILDYYNDKGVLKDSFDVWSYDLNAVTASRNFTISVVDDRIVIAANWIAIPGYSRYGTDTTILAVTADGFDEQLNFGGGRFIGSCTLHVDDESVEGDEDMGEETYGDLQTLLADELTAIGMEWTDMRFGWDQLYDLSYGIEVDFSAKSTALFSFGSSGYLTHFVDHTNLRDALSE